MMNDLMYLIKNSKTTIMKDEMKFVGLSRIIFIIIMS